MLDALIKSAKNAARELSDLDRLFQPENKRLRTLIFFGESGIFYRYYEDYIEHICANSDLDICYISSDDEDPIFESTNKRIKPFYIKNSLVTAFSRLDGKVLVIATPDLNSGAVKRAPDPVKHVYAFRGIASVHQAYRKTAFDHYDALLCVAPYQVAELHKMEEIYKLPAKELILTGYPLVERIYRDHLEFMKSAKTKSDLICLVAPTWDATGGNSSILDVCINELITELSKTPYQVWIRPHPEYAKRFPKKMNEIKKAIDRHKNISLQTSLSSMQILHEADFLITDHSSISMDYALGTQRQPLFIDTQLRVDNPQCCEVGIEPIENVYRSQLGLCLRPENMKDLAKMLEQILNSREEYSKSVPQMRDELVANWQHAARIGGDYILSLCV